MASSVPKVAFAVVCIIIIALHIAGLLTYWRDVHDVSDFTIMRKYLINIMNVSSPKNEYLSYMHMHNTTDEVALQFGILNNCNFKNDAFGKCEVPKNFGFVDDTAALVLLCIAIALYAITLFLALLSISFPTVVYVFPLTFCIAFLCALIGFAIASSKEFYISYEEKNTMSDREREAAENLAINIQDYYVSAKFPWKITYGAGFYITLAAWVIAFISVCISGDIYKEKKSEKSIKNDSIPPPQHQQQVPAAHQQNYPTQANQYPQQPHQGFPQQLPAQLPPYQYQQHQGYPQQLPAVPPT